MNNIKHPNLVYRLKLLQDEKGWNLSDIARHAMVSPQAVQQWAKGKSLPRGQGLKRLAAAAGKAEHWFFMSPDAESQGESHAETFSGRKLDENEQLLLSLFNQLPETEKLRLLISIKSQLEELDQLKGDVLNMLQSNPPRP
ncbi:transcriptional regulator [Salmonella enterica subsp. enterica serovar Oranienburg]|nr:transcriptional regulator [Salmonella enterica subsp. enterica serovar Oranienburg]